MFELFLALISRPGTFEVLLRRMFNSFRIFILMLIIRTTSTSLAPQKIQHNCPSEIYGEKYAKRSLSQIGLLLFDRAPVNCCNGRQRFNIETHKLRGTVLSPVFQPSYCTPWVQEYKK